MRAPPFPQIWRDRDSLRSAPFANSLRASRAYSLGSLQAGETHDAQYNQDDSSDIGWGRYWRMGTALERKAQRWEVSNFGRYAQECTHGLDMMSVLSSNTKPKCRAGTKRTHATTHGNSQWNPSLLGGSPRPLRGWFVFLFLFWSYTYVLTEPICAHANSNLILALPISERRRPVALKPRSPNGAPRRSALTGANRTFHS